MILGDDRERRMLEKNRDVEERSGRRFCSISVGILLTKFVADFAKSIFDRFDYLGDYAFLYNS